MLNTVNNAEISNVVFTISPTDSVGESVNFRAVPFFHPLVRTDTVATVSHERLEQSRWNWRRIFISPCWLRRWALEVKVKGQGCSRTSRWNPVNTIS